MVAKRHVWRIAVAVMLGAGAVALAGMERLYGRLPRGNTQQTRFDVIIVLGTPAKRKSGRPTPEMRSRVEEGVRLYKAHIADHLLMTGGAAHNCYTEAEVMAALAVSLGVPSGAISIEPHAHNTKQNAAFSVAIMRQQGWRAALVVSSPAHLPRAGYVFSCQPILYRMQAAPWPRSFAWYDKEEAYVWELLDATRIRAEALLTHSIR